MLRHLTITVFLVLFMSLRTWGADPTAYVINTSAETLSRINLTTGYVANDILPLGSDISSYPNQIIVRDTLAYILCSGTNEIQIINIKTETTVGWIDLPGGSNPFNMAFLDDQYLYVTLLLDNSLAKVDVIARQVTKVTSIGQSPEGILLFDNKAFVAITAFDFGSYTYGQGLVAVYDVTTDQIVDEIEVGKNPQYLDFDQRGMIHVSCTGDYGAFPGKAYIINPHDYSVVDSLALGGQPGRIAVSRTGSDNEVFIAAGGWSSEGQVFSYNATTGEIHHSSTNPIDVTLGATGVTAFQDSTIFVVCFADKVDRINMTGQRINSYSVGDSPIDIDFNYQPGDANGDWQINVGDAVYIINYVFRGGPLPRHPMWRSDANADARINIGDAVYLISYIFRGGPRPSVGTTWLR